MHSEGLGLTLDTEIFSVDSFLALSAKNIMSMFSEARLDIGNSTDSTQHTEAMD